MIKIKVCGLRPGDDLRFTEAMNVSHIGVVLVPASKRYVALQQIANMVQGRSVGVKVLGVFTDLAVENILGILRESGIEGAQLHGDESPATCAILKQNGYEVWKAIRVSKQDTAVDLLRQILSYAQVVDAVLLDAAPQQIGAQAVTGGHGITFDWAILAEFAALQQATKLPPIWIAGGLTPDNVGALLNVFQPFGVDVSSGVEIAGRKDQQRILAFIEAVKQNDRTIDVSN